MHPLPKKEHAKIGSILGHAIFQSHDVSGMKDMELPKGLSSEKQEKNLK